MVTDAIGRNRSQGVYRVAAFIVYALIGWVIAAVALIAAMLFAIVDLLVQLILNDEGWTRTGSGAAGLLVALYQWNLDILDYIFFGSRSFPWTPNL